jgi:hypothetical protein
MSVIYIEARVLVVGGPPNQGRTSFRLCQEPAVTQIEAPQTGASF